MKNTKIDTQKILLIWEGHKNEFKQYHLVRDKIREIVKEQGKKNIWTVTSDASAFDSRYYEEIDDRTIMRYLQSLVNERKLEKKINSDHRTYYKPTNDTEVFREIAKNRIEAIETPELVAFLTYFLMNLSNSEFMARDINKPIDSPIELSIELLDSIVEKAKTDALGITHHRIQWKEAAKELGLDTSPGGVTA